MNVTGKAADEPGVPGAGIGMFLAFIGLQYQEGIGAVTADPSTLVTLGES